LCVSDALEGAIEDDDGASLLRDFESVLKAVARHGGVLSAAPSGDAVVGDVHDGLVVVDIWLLKRRRAFLAKKTLLRIRGVCLDAALAEKGGEGPGKDDEVKFA